MKIYFSLWT